MKKTQIIIITIALILTLGCVGTFAVLYLATDSFKSEQEMFYKYASQINLKEFVDLESYSNYLKRLESEAYSTKGDFNIEIEQEEEGIFESIEYNGYIDPINKTANYDINLKKDDEMLLALNYLKKQDLHGILFKDVVSEYIVIENNNLKEFASKFGIQDVNDIPDKIELPENNSINYQEINSILNKYLNVIIETIPEDNYSKIKKTEILVDSKKIETDGYQIKLKAQDLQAILIKILEQAKGDEQIFNLLNTEDVTFQEYQVEIEEILAVLKEENLNDQNTDFVTISVYKQGKDTVKLSINITPEEDSAIEISLEKLDKGLILRILTTETKYDETQEQFSIVITKIANSEQQENIQCTISEISDGEEVPITNINLTRNGAFTSNNVEIDLKITSNIALTGLTSLNFSIELQNAVDFSATPPEGDFEGGNHLVINGLTSEQLNNLVNNLGTILGEKLKDEMFISMINSIINTNDGLFEKAEQAAQDFEEAMENEETLRAEIYDSNESIMNSMASQKIQTFNSQFTAYEGVRKGAEIKGLYSGIASSNATDTEHLVECSGISKEQIISSKNYSVSLKYGSEGYVNQIIIEEVN